MFSHLNIPAKGVAVEFKDSITVEVYVTIRIYSSFLIIWLVPISPPHKSITCLGYSDNKAFHTLKIMALLMPRYHKPRDSLPSIFHSNQENPKFQFQEQIFRSIHSNWKSMVQVSSKLYILPKISLHFKVTDCTIGFWVCFQILWDKMFRKNWLNSWILILVKLQKK